MKQDLINTALLGTEKKGLNLEILPSYLSEQITMFNDLDSEEKLLLSAGLIFAYCDSGLKLTKSEAYQKTYIYEEKKPAEPHYCSLINDILALENNIKEFYFNLWLDKILKRDEIIDKYNLSTFILYIKGLNNVQKEKCIKALGQAGIDIISEYSEFKKLVRFVKINDWEECDLHSRLILLSSDRELYFDQVLKDWPSESLTTKKAYIDLWKDNPNNFEIEFLRKLRSDEFLPKPNEKKVEKDIRILINQIFHKYNIDEYRQELFQKFKKYCNKGSLNLPKSEDDIFNVDYLSMHYNFTIKNNYPAYFKNDIIYWFSNILSIYPLRDWANALQLSLDDTIKYFLEDKQFTVIIEGKSERIMTQSLRNNIANYFEDEIAIKYLKYFKNTNFDSLIQKLSPAIFESYCIENDYYDNESFIYYWTEDKGFWSLDFSQKLHNRLFEKIVEGQYNYYKTYIDCVVKFTNTKVEDTLNSLKEKITLSATSDRWLSLIYKPVMNSIELRKRIENY